MYIGKRIALLMKKISQNASYTLYMIIINLLIQILNHLIDVHINFFLLSKKSMNHLVHYGERSTFPEFYVLTITFAYSNPIKHKTIFFLLEVKKLKD